VDKEVVRTGAGIIYFLYVQYWIGSIQDYLYRAFYVFRNGVEFISGLYSVRSFKMVV
jgi:hypothetical protein